MAETVQDVSRETFELAKATIHRPVAGLTYAKEPNLIQIQTEPNACLAAMVMLLWTLLALGAGQGLPATKPCQTKNWHFAFGKCHQARREVGLVWKKQ